MPASVSSSLQSFIVVSSHILSPVTVTSAAASSEKMPTSSLSSQKIPQSLTLSLTTKANSPSQPTSQTASSSLTRNPVPSSPTRFSSADAPSTTTSVTIIKGSAPAWTSTITTHPDTTLSTAVALVTTDSNGAKILTTPPLVTIMSTSSEANGSFTIVTHVVANPSIGAEQLTTKSSILQNQGAVAGIFISVGIIIASIIAGLIYCYKRNQRIARRNRWLAGMQRQQPSISLSEDPFQDSNDQHDTKTAPAMRSLDSGYHAFQWDRMDAGSLLENSLNHESPSIASQHLHHPDIQTMSIPADPGFSDADEDRNMGLGYSTDPPTNNIPRYRHSLTSSTPSIYPSILLPQGDDFHEAEDDFPSVTQRPEGVVNVPPRPPRSHLRESAKKLDFSPLTPSGSDSSHTYTNTSTLVSESRPQDVLSRRTILDPRTRSNSP